MSMITDLDATGQAELVKTGQVSPLELTEAAIEAAERLDPQLGVMLDKKYDYAREQASTADKDALFPGVPILMKDWGVRVKGFPLSQGALPWLRKNPQIAEDDSHLAADFRSAGLSFLGRSNTIFGGLFIATPDPELYVNSRNPWNPDYCTGGSSAGSAAAVAAHIVPIGHGNDGGGSIRMPASLTGTIGFKPTRARVSMGPYRSELVAIAAAWGVEFALTRSVRDTHALFNHVQGWRPGDLIPMDAQPIPPRSQLTKRPLRIGLTTTPFMHGIDCDPENARIAEETALLLERLGHTVEKVEAPRYNLGAVEWEYGAPAGPAFASMARAADRYNRLAGRELGAEDYSAPVNAAFELGRSYTARQVEEFGEVMSRYVLEWDNWWVGSGIDILLTPTTAGGTPTMRDCLPPPLGDFVIPEENPLIGTTMLMPLIPFTQAINWSGQPAVSLPIYLGSNGLPMGSHLAAPRMRDDLLFQLMYEIEEAVPWNAGLSPAVKA